jgi:thiol-disulfide isomerase/thioredoxin
MADKFFYKGSRVVKELSPSDFHSVKEWELISNKCSILLIYADWCGHCKRFREEYENFAANATFLDVLALNGSEYSSLMSKIKEDKPGLFNGFPTIVYFSGGKPVEAYRGDRSEADLLNRSMEVCVKSFRQIRPSA